MKKRIIIISSIIILSIVIVGIYSTFATDEASISNNTYDFILSGNNGEITVPAGSSKTVIYKVTNTNRGKVRYGVSYFGDNISVKVYEDSSDDITGYIDYGETKFIKLYIENSSDSDSTVTIKTALGYEAGGELEGTPAVPDGYSLVSEVHDTSIKFVDYLTDLYLSANPTKSTVANNGINYYYAPSVSMMNDGMNTSHVWEDGVNTGNIRYYGKTPANYIDIGDRDSSGNIIPWRIIGVFKNMKLADGTTDTLIKVVREDVEPVKYLGELENNWHENLYQEFLNGSFYEGLSQDVKGKIAEVQWNIGGYNDDDVYSNDIYFYERGNAKCSDCTYDTIWTGNIAFIYPSDYGFSSDLTRCNKKLNYYNNDSSNCLDTNWLYHYALWTITPASDDMYNKIMISRGGNLIYLGVVLNSTGLTSGSAFPTLYLKSDLIYDSGDGSSVENAYVVK